MNKYKVLQAFELEGVPQEVEAVIELSEDKAADLVADGKLELVPAAE